MKFIDNQLTLHQRSPLESSLVQRLEAIPGWGWNALVTKLAAHCSNLKQVMQATGNRVPSHKNKNNTKAEQQAAIFRKESTRGEQK